MVNFNGNLLSEDSTFLNHQNRGLKYGDAVFETLRVVNGAIYFWEDHYFRLMASMRVLRMEIPMEFTLEFLQDEILKTVDSNDCSNEPCRVRLTVFRKDGGLYTPATNDVSYVIEVKKLDSPFYILSEAAYEVELFKDYYVNADMLSNLKTTNKIINVVAGVFATENDYDNCMLLNGSKQVVEAINGNIFLVNGTTVKTPPLKDGCLDGVLRKKLMQIIERDDVYELLEESISPFELQKADELFLTNVVVGIQPFTKYRKKEFSSEVSKKFIGKLNAAARLA
ncbi:aminotransferase class IV [Allomuricauda sp. d1]|uniref:aminotransferase class IV n=1 Tax=Allomuricauda sp. d1 TaxID=3136725 RepID=UPI0031CEFE74